MTSTIMADWALKLDPVLLAERAGIMPDPWQRDLLRSTSGRILLNCCRQSGKSTMAAIIAVHTAIYTPSSLVLLLSASLRQSGELFKKCSAIYRDLGRPVPSQSETALTLTLCNGSRIVSLPGSDDSLVRGYSGVALLVIDEAARVDDSLYHSVRPMLAVSGGRIIALSTCWGKRGWWYEAWTGPEPWERYLVPATECPRISPDFLAEERRTLGPLIFGQEYENTFADTLEQVFSYDVVMSALSDDVVPLFGTGGNGWGATLSA